MLTPLRLKKPKRNIYDFLAERRPEPSQTLVILPRENNPVDTLFTGHFAKYGKHLNPSRIRNWFVVGKYGDKIERGRIVDILLSRDLLVRPLQGDRKAVPIPFEHVVFLRPNQP